MATLRAIENVIWQITYALEDNSGCDDSWVPIDEDPELAAEFLRICSLILISDEDTVIQITDDFYMNEYGRIGSVDGSMYSVSILCEAGYIEDIFIKLREMLFAKIGKPVIPLLPDRKSDGSDE